MGNNCLSELYEELSKKIKNEIKEKGSTLAKFNPLKLSFCDDVEVGDLARSDYLKNLNQEYAYPLSLMNLNNVTTPRKGLIGKIVLKIKRRIQKFIAGILSDYIEAQKNYNADTVRFLNEVSRYVDKRDNYIFLELIRKIDSDLRLLDEKLDELSNAQNVIYNNIDKKFEDYHTDNILKLIKSVRLRDNNIQVRINTLYTIVEGIEGIVSRLNDNNVNSQNKDVQVQKEGINNSKIDYRYLLLENRFRGSSSIVKERLKIYVDAIKDLNIQNQNVVELGPGRGELLEMLKEKNINATGVELNDAMCDVLRDKKLNFVKSDALSYLETLSDDSVSCIIGIQIVEHLDIDYLIQLLNVSYRVLQKGGIIIFETVNPLSFYALSNNFTRDYTHKAPLHPEALAYMSKLSGFKVRDILKLSKVSDDIQLKSLSTNEFMAPSVVELVQEYNDNILKLNDLLYGYQDYALIAKK